ncbi:MAG: diaminopimelate epimerase [Aquificaceae bacterium]|nr:diaminopimelate epimerase [Aquificaceae bacterium]MDW8294273.1 diaminopimelate epimerase [Aquificaceae bacterium]
MEFAKLQGSGNDFILIDNRDGKVDLFLRRLGLEVKDFVLALCEPHRGIGADGLILIENPSSPENHFRWQFFNADGSVAEMCGNGSRCAVRFAYDRGIVDKEARFETLAGVIEAWVFEGGSRVKVQLTKPRDYREATLDIDGHIIEGSFINTGVPHFVVVVDELEALDIKKLGRAIRFHKEFEPKGTNVNFIQPLSRRAVRIRTYERGVEGETLACGTGAVASALVAYRKGLVKEKPVEVYTKGGELLRVDFEDNLEETFLEGGVCKVFEGFFTEELFLCMRKLRHQQR